MREYSMDDRDSNLDLPVPALKLDLASQQLIEQSRVKKLIGPLVAKVREKRAQKIGVFSWDSEEASRKAAQILAAGLAQQFDRRCALVVVEGIRFNCENFDCYSLVTLPEIENPNFSEPVENFLHDMNRNFPFQILAGPSIKNWDTFSRARAKLALNTDAQILVMPQSGVAREAEKKISAFTKQRELMWLGIVSLDSGRASHA